MKKAFNAKILSFKKNSHLDTLAVLKSILPYKVRKAHQQGKQGAQNHNDYAILRSAQNDEKLLFPRPLRESGLRAEVGGAFFGASEACEKKVRRPVKCEQPSRVRVRGYKKLAFSLAEVLITLGIIGVVAALTLPTVINNYQKKVFVNQVKQTYTLISNALQMSVNEYGQISNWNLGDTTNSKQILINDFENVVKTYFLPYLKVVKHGIESNGNYCAVLSNGIGLTFIPYVNVTGSFESGPIYRLVSVEIIANVKGKCGMDDLDASRNYSKTDINMLVNPDNSKLGFYCSSCDRNELIRGYFNCSKSSTPERRLPCAQLIMYDGWQIKDDYPW